MREARGKSRGRNCLLRQARAWNGSRIGRKGEKRLGIMGACAISGGGLWP